MSDLSSSSNNYEKSLQDARETLLHSTFDQFWIQSEHCPLLQSKNSHNHDSIPFMSPRRPPRFDCQSPWIRWIGIFLSIFLLLLISLPFLIRSEYLANHYRHQCSSFACLTASHRIIENLNLHRNPCDDFFRYACDGWDQSHLLSPSETSNSYFKEISKTNSMILYKILQESSNTTLQSTNKLKTFFYSCMDRVNNDRTRCNTLQQVLSPLGELPMFVDQWSTDQWNLLSNLVYTHQYRINPLFRMSVTVDEKDNQYHRISFEQSGLSFEDRSLYDNEDLRDLFNQIGSELIDACRCSSLSSSQLIQSMDEIFLFEQRLAKLFPRKYSNNPWHSYHLYSFEEISQKFFSWLNINEYLQQIFGKDETFFTNQSFLLANPGYFQKLGETIQTTPSHILANYIAFQMIQELVPYMSEHWTQIRRPLLTYLKGVTEDKPWWEICVRRTDEAFGFATGALFISKVFDVKNKEMIEHIVEEIRRTFLETLSKIEWMDDQTRAQAALKAKLMLNRLGYPKWLADEKQIDRVYQDLNLSLDNNSLMNFLLVRRFQKQQNLKKLDTKPDIEEWTMTPIDVNAYYAPWKNMIVFPAGILQAPFFDPNVPISLNFGSIASIIGHELIHAFDASGRFFDGHGNLHDWWQSESAQHFNERAQCFIDQYNQYYVDKKHLNGILTLDENIADNGGVRIAYTAYQRYTKHHHHLFSFKRTKSHSQQLLPGLNLTDEQLFFVGFAQTWCMKTTPQAAQAALVTDTHAHPKYRVIGSLSNMPEFSRAFNCPINSTMNPEKRCQIWSQSVLV